MKEVTNSDQLSRLLIENYKSIKHCDIKMGCLNVLIGANGAGKSNFIGFLKLIPAILEHRLQLTVGKSGGPDALLHFGRKVSDNIKGEFYFGNNGYKFNLEPTSDNRMLFSRESLWWNMAGDMGVYSGHFESMVDNHRSGVKQYTLPIMRMWRVYHFHDTSDSAKVKQVHRINDNEYLREDGSNLAAFLYRLKENHKNNYKRIVKTIQMVAPFFGDFYLRSTASNSDFIELEWTEKDQDIPFKANELSDGTLRFICLATVLLQPEEFMPSAIIVDEPELGLHPYAISVLAALISAASNEHQLIVSTQSVELVNEFDIEDLIVVDRVDGASTFKRLEEEHLNEWLQDYSLGEMWKKNLLGGRPQR
ncbi:MULTISPECIES: AAA family ATPase [Vibrio]|uniref:AAA family ATPase n=1 Tax=Vibrio TaxID=662 RepID=UPI002075351C|nr:MULTISPECIES: AAA family ATPase [Vibrio]USD35356.1 AAA family ATPase [Vibrio sp. SCSIO 43186]USD48423.1 AAA family ATPase [Vibrio sp. SCSIO 43145]USD72481.1 AAA family ATPase [Vibrio sp. SCSIO 43139]USD98157.1 chromosome segregation protein SMC [Vibrio coralliilyticus]